MQLSFASLFFLLFLSFSFATCEENGEGRSDAWWSCGGQEQPGRAAAVAEEAHSRRCAPVSAKRRPAGSRTSTAATAAVSTGNSRQRACDSSRTRNAVRPRELAATTASRAVRRHGKWEQQQQQQPWAEARGRAVERARAAASQTCGTKHCHHNERCHKHRVQVEQHEGQARAAATAGFGGGGRV